MQRGIGLLILLTLCSLLHAQQTPPQQAPATTTAADAAPLPDIQTLIARVRAKQKSLEDLRKHYTFTITQVADDFSSNGSKKTHTDIYQAFFVSDVEIDQHLSRDGKPLPPADAAKEQARVDKLTAAIKAHEIKVNKDQVKLSASDLLRVATFSNGRREQIDNRSTLVFDYRGNPGAKANSLSEQVMRDLAGTLWVDERDNAILRLTGSLDQNFHVGGGLLVNIKKGSRFDFVQQKINGEIWFPQTFVVHVDGRFLLVKGFNGDAHLAYSDYRKMKTTVTILPGSRLVDENGNPTSPVPPSENTNGPTPQK